MTLPIAGYIPNRGPVPQYATNRTPNAKHIGVRVNGVERYDVLSYSVKEGWAKCGRIGATGVVTIKGKIEPYWRS